MKAKLTISNKKFVIDLLETVAPNTCNAFWKRIPLESYATHAKFAGGEFFFMVPFLVDPENQINVTAGDVAYYPEKQTVCVFYGRLCPFAKVNLFGKVMNNLEGLRIVGREILAKRALAVSVKKLS